ncbi:hypothetical protein O181_036233 [Austropuccinia psidii MF-1]|uniref:Integrase catalytic domain-containing protein n=1 Tax=Austropuccinia psidii MF-1 TaxID=1389203 RepID=A0A9Q3D706_9BASI|nr:hypothetical protein [Austropuccinia psidii MF-1]
MTLFSRLLINTILHEFPDIIYSEHLSEDRTLEKVKNCARWPYWRKETIEYCHTCDRCHKANRSTGKKFGLMIHIEEPESPWEVFRMDWATALPSSGDRSYNSCLVILDRYSKPPIFLPCHKDDTAMDTALLLWNRFISHTGFFKNIIGDRDPNFTSALWTNLNRLFGTKYYSTQHTTLKVMGPRKPNNSYVGPFFIVSLHGKNAVQVELSGELENKHPTFPVSLIKPYQPSDKESFPLRNPTSLTVPQVEQSEDKKIKKFIKERRLRGKNKREYLFRYRNPVHEDEWVAKSEIFDSDKLWRRFRHERRTQA